MRIIFNVNQLDGLFPFIQQFINHSGIVYKVYVVGDNWVVLPRPSVPTFSGESQEVYSYDTLWMAKSFPATEESLHEAYLSRVNSEYIKLLVESLKMRTKLGLFGFDVLVEEDTFVHYVIDVNYFPGYHEVPQFDKWLFDYIQQRLK